MQLYGLECPYSATILVSKPHQGKLTIKADQIFEEFIGIDLHQKFTVKKEIDSNAIYKHGIKQHSSFPQPKDVCVIEDGKDCTSQVPTEEFHYLNQSKGETSFMPSFDFLDGESEEGELSPELEESTSEILTGETIFEHIHRKPRTSECSTN